MLERKSIKCNNCSVFAVVLCVCGGGGGGHSATMHTIFDQTLACSEYEEEFRLHVLTSFSRLSP